MKKTIYVDDDKIIYIAPKTNSHNKRKLNLSNDWKSNPVLHSHYNRKGEIVIAGYFRPDCNDPNICPFISNHDFSSLSPSEKIKWRPYPVKEIKLKNRMKVLIKNNYLKLIIPGLQSFHQPRSSLAFDCIKQLYRCGILKCNAERADEDLWKKFVQQWLVYEYEHNVFFDGWIGKKLFKALKASRLTTLPTFPSTIYIKEYKRGQVRTKFYNKTAQIQNRQGNNINRATDLYKLEITLRTEFFRRQGVQDIRLYKSQPEIQQIPEVHSVIRKELRQVYNLIQPLKLRKQLQKELGVSNAEAFLDGLMDVRLTNAMLGRATAA